jgi:hypothetical protein
MDLHIIIRRFQVKNIMGGDDLDLAAVLDHDALAL